MFAIFFLLVLTLPGVAGEDEGVCQVRYLDTPIAAKDGDFIIGGMFQIGQLEYTDDDDGTKIPVQSCSYSGIEEYGIQKAIALRMVIDKENERFKKDFNKTLGYEMYGTCMSSAVTGRISAALASNKKVIGVSGVDYKEYTKRSAAIMSSFHIPTFVYMFNDDELMTGSMYPNLFSMIDTEVKEAEITIRFLEKMGYQYMDIWYHEYSKDMAEHIFNSYVKKVGCGRITDVTSKDHIPRIKQTYNETGGTPSRVQLILQNSAATTRAMLKEMVGNLGFRDKIYILGLSNGRYSFLNRYTAILNTSGHNTLILPLPDLLNVKMDQTLKDLNKDWRQVKKRDYIDDLYQKVQSYRCPKDGDEPKMCKLTSWIPYMVGGVKLVLESLHAILTNMVVPVLPGGTRCLMDYKTKLFNQIVNENRTLNVTLEENVTIPIRMFNKTVNTGYRIGVYKTETQTFRTLGRAFVDRIEVMNESLLESMSGYNKTCSYTCQPGTHRRFNRNIQYLPCCWTCEDCNLHQYSTENDTNVCKVCDPSMSANENNTACVLAPEIYIQPNSPTFIVGASSMPLGMAMVIVFGVVIFRNEDRPVIKASDPGYLYMVLLSLLIGYPTALTPLFKASTTTCSAEYYSFAIFATLISTNLLYKCVKVYDIFAAAQSFSAPKFGLLLKRTGQTAFNLLTLAITVIILLIDSNTGRGPSWAFERYQEESHKSWHLRCTSINSKTLVIPIVLPGLSFLVTLVLAFKMRKFPHNFRESLNIFCATFVVLLCSIMFLAGYGFSPPKIQAMLRAIVVSITSTAFLLSIFIPKICILMDKNINVEEERTKIRDGVTKFSSGNGPSLSGVARQVIKKHPV
ncbi:metabotropic glutamate receptor 4-like [Bolinopsis microptera]|uniref:metabotropic glutamate receptor 4-like n=1 Tax=Bolinopsis microptera TaxID=2820187 RepID=UPI00307A165D